MATVNLIMALTIIGTSWFLLDKLLRAKHQRDQQYNEERCHANGRAQKWLSEQVGEPHRATLNSTNRVSRTEAAMSRIDSAGARAPRRAKQSRK